MPFLLVAFGQAIAIVMVSLELTYRLRKLGESSTKAILTGDRSVSLAQENYGVEESFLFNKLSAIANGGRKQR